MEEYKIKLEKRGVSVEITYTITKTLVSKHSVTFA